MNSIKTLPQFVDLAPSIVRHRLVIECLYQNNLDIKKYYLEESGMLPAWTVMNLDPIL